MGDKTEFLRLFPIYLNEPGFQPPEKGMYYLIAGNGIFLHKDTAIGSVLVQVNDIAGLVEAKNDFQLTLPRIPGLVIGQALTFFRKVFEDLQSEAYLHLFFSRKFGQFRLWCPRQEVSRGGVECDSCDQMSYEERTGRKPGEPCGEAVWQLIGSVHPQPLRLASLPQRDGHRGRGHLRRHPRHARQRGHPALLDGDEHCDESAPPAARTG